MIFPAQILWMTCAGLGLWSLPIAVVAQEQPLPQAPYSEGYFGVGHDLWHHIYRGMRNAENVSCCGDGDCRPTTTKVVDGRLYAKVNGEWALAPPGKRVPAFPYSWSETAHVCTQYPSSTAVICVVPEAPGF